MLNYNNLTPARKVIINQIIKLVPAVLDSKKITRSELVDCCEAFSKSPGYLNWIACPSNSTNQRGVFHFPIPNDESSEDEVFGIVQLNNQFVDNRTDEEIKTFFIEKYNAIEDVSTMVSKGEVRSLIVSGSPGFGKTTRIIKNLDKLDVDYKEINVKITSRMLYKELYNYRESGQVLVIDDADSCFDNEDGLNLIKASTDSKIERRVSRFVEGKIIDDENGELIPKTFIYKGQVIFITNKNLQGESESNSKNSEHIKAIISRGSYIDLKINTIRERLIAIKMMIDDNILNQFEFSKEQENELYEFIVDNGENFRDLSIRTLINVVPFFKNKENWKELIKHSFFK